MEVQRLGIDGAFLFTPAIDSDDRGSFLEWFRTDVFEEATGHPFRLAQANCTVSKAGAIRGIHFAQLPPGQARYVSCARGEVLAVVVDIRLGSPTYGKWEAVSLDDKARKLVYLGEGLGHAFMAMEDDTVVNYLCSAPDVPDREHRINPMDESLAIDWPVNDLDGRTFEHRLSPEDAAAPSLAAVEGAGLLPTMEETQAWLRALRGKPDSPRRGILTRIPSLARRGRNQRHATSRGGRGVSP